MVNWVLLVRASVANRLVLVRSIWGKYPVLNCRLTTGFLLVFGKLFGFIPAAGFVLEESKSTGTLQAYPRGWTAGLGICALLTAGGADRIVIFIVLLG